MDGTVWATIIGGMLGFLASVLPRAGELLQGHLQHKQDHATETLRIEAMRTNVPPPAPVCEPLAPVAPAPVAPPATCPPPPPVEPAPVFMNPGVEGEVVAAPEERHDVEEHAVQPDDDENDTVVKGSPFWTMVFDALRASVRPVITYGFFLLFVIIKLQGLWHGSVVDHTPIIQLLPVIWDEGSGSLFAAILAFWFGSRAFERGKAFIGKAQ